MLFYFFNSPDVNPDVWIIDLLILLIKASWLICVAHMIFCAVVPRAQAHQCTYFYQKLFYLTRCQAPELPVSAS